MRIGTVPKIVASVIEGSLRQRIAAGEWATTGRLPAERELAAEYGVARNTLRRAVEAIANDGTIERHIGRGTFVNGEAAEIADIVQRVTGVSPADLMAARLIVEPQAAAIAARNASLADLQAITEAHHQASKAHQNDDFEHWDTQFHQRLFAATRNELLASIHAILQVIRSRNAWIELKRKTFSENRRRDYCEQHGAVVIALQNRDADGAAQAMLRHIETIEVALFGRR
jgi:DNA-binding FadR family transcriptional regulator